MIVFLVPIAALLAILKSLVDRCCARTTTAASELVRERFSFDDLKWAAKHYHAQAAHKRKASWYTLKTRVMQSAAVIKEVGFEAPDPNPGGQSVGTPRGNKKPEFNKERYRQAEGMFATMAANQSMFVIRVMAYILRKVWPMLYYFGIHVNDDEVERLREASKRAPVIYLPTHKSHIDYLMMSYLCFEHDLQLPLVVSGDNLNIPIIGRILRYGGAFFIRRTFAKDKDRLYAAVFKEYVKNVICAGYSIECYIEGGRSRSGKVLPPKIGVLSCIVEALIDGEVEDVMLAPISLCYDRIVENEAYVEELSGGSKTKERLIPVIRRISSLLHRAATKVVCFGRVDIRIAEPISLRELIHSILRKESNIAQVSHVLQDNSLEKLRGNDAIVKSIAYSAGFQVLRACNDASVVLPTALVASILLSYHQRGITAESLLEQVNWLRDQVIARNGKVVPYTPDSINLVVSLVLQGIVGKNVLVKKHKNTIMLSLYNPKERMELALYRNQLIHHFVEEGIVACAIYAYEKREEKVPAAVLKDKLLELVRDLSKMLKFEFIYEPLSNLQKTFNETLDKMIAKGILRAVDDQRVAIDDSEEATKTYLFLCGMFWHYIDSYWLVILGLYSLFPDKLMSEEGFLKRVQTIGETLYFEGQLDLYEAVAKDTLQNAINLCKDWKVLEVITVDTVPQPLLRLTRQYQEIKALEELMQFSKFRKRARAYRSRRLASRHVDEVTDAIQIVQNRKW